MSTMKDVGDGHRDHPVKRGNGDKTPLTKTHHPSPNDDHFDVTGPKPPRAYYAGGFGWSGENTNEPGDGTRPHEQQSGLTTDKKMSKKAFEANGSEPFMNGRVGDPHTSTKVTPDSKYPYDDMSETPVQGLKETPEGSSDGMMVVVTWVGASGAGAETITWREFLDANPDIADDPEHEQRILSSIRSGETYTERGADGRFSLRLVEGVMKKIREDASACAVGAGNIGMVTQNAFTTSRTKEAVGQVDDDTPDDEDEDEMIGENVSFTRNGVPYRGRVMESHGNFYVVSTGGRRLMVEKELVDLDGAPEPISAGPTQYGVKTAKQDHAQSSPTTPNKTMQKFVGAMGEELGDEMTDDDDMSLDDMDSL